MEENKLIEKLLEENKNLSQPKEEWKIKKVYENFKQEYQNNYKHSHIKDNIDNISKMYAYKKTLKEIYKK